MLYKTEDGLDHGGPQRLHCRTSCQPQGKWTAAEVIYEMMVIDWHLHLAQHSGYREESSLKFSWGRLARPLQAFVKNLQVMISRIVMEMEQGMETAKMIRK